MQSAFLVIAVKPGRRPTATARHLTREEKPTGLTFRPGGHVCWSGDNARISVGVWQDETVSEDGARWHVTGERITATVGHLRWRGRPWSADVTWAAALSGAVGRDSMRAVADELVGVFAAASFESSGRGTVLSDPLGFRCVYYGETDDVFVASSRATLAAAALAPDGERPARDPIGVAWLAFSTYVVGERTGFASVKVLPAGSVIEFRPGAAPVIERCGPVWMPTPAMRDARRDELVEAARAGITESLVAAATFTGGERRVGLTGGKDSRVLLAAILTHDLRDEFVFETRGPPHLDDVVIASALAERFALRHRVEFSWNPPSSSYVDRARTFVAATAGMSNVWSLRAVGTSSDDVWVNGLVGEGLRSFRLVREDLRTTDDLVQFFSERTGFGQLGLLKPEIEEQCRREATEALLGPAWELPPADVLHAFYLRHRVRFARLGPLEELNAERWVMPFYGSDVLRAAFAIGAEARRIELLHFEIIRQASDALAQHPFAGPGWHPSLIEGAPDVDEYRPPTPPGSSRAPAPRKKSEPWRARIQRKSFETRKHELHEILADRASPAWEILDQGRALRALERFPSLGNMERTELYGAVTAALWLSAD
jgi:hypothetical protein